MSISDFLWSKVTFSKLEHRIKLQPHGHQSRIPTVKLKIPGKAFLKSESRTSVTLFIFSHFFMAAYLLSPNRCHWQIAKVKNYNLNVTEVRDSDFKNAFPRIFDFTVGILTVTSRVVRSLKITASELFDKPPSALSVDTDSSIRVNFEFNLRQNHLRK